MHFSLRAFRKRVPLTTRPTVLDIATAAGFALPFPLVTLVVRYGPSQVDPLASPLILGYAPLVALIGMLVATPLFLHAIIAEKPRSFAAGALAACLLPVGAAAAFGSVAHRDYFTAVFQYVIATFALFLYWLRSRPVSQVRPETFRSVGRAGYAAFLLLTVWIMMMGYAISTRAEPRPIESILYNSYNMLLDFALLVGSRELVLRSLRTLSLRRDGAVLLDGAPVDFVLGAGGIRILRTFLSSPERRATCADIGRNALESGMSKRRSDCALCEAEGSKASLCPEYRATYNRVLELKKLLEFLEVGSILPPKNKRRVLAEGWRLALFENVRVEMQGRIGGDGDGSASQGEKQGDGDS
jgi:hypothetical protein